MKNRKKALAVTIERRNALYNKTILHNRELAEKNTELSHVVDHWRAKCNRYERILNEPKWWQFWKHIHQETILVNETEVECFGTRPRFVTITHFYGKYWKSLIRF
jgi:hypothetical protein